jgi:elongation factor Ts
MRRFFSKVNVADIKKLRELTSAPMSDCKKALLESNNDISEAKKILIKRNLIFSEKKEGRAQKEGVWGFKTNEDRTKAVMLNLTCETDFVAKSETFINFC